MVALNSAVCDFGLPAIDFALPDINGQRRTLADCRGPNGLLVMFICNHCPFVKHVRHELAALGRDYPRDRLGIVAINPNDAAAYPDDSPEQMRRESSEIGYTFPYLVDASQEVAKSYRAACTPDFYLFGPLEQGRRLVYRGQLDDSRPGNGIPVTGRDLRKAIDTLLSGAEVPEDQRPSLGCNIKWRVGGEPDYYGGVMK